MHAADGLQQINRAHQRLDRHGIGRGRDHQKVAALGQRLQLLAVRPGLGIEDDVLEVAAYFERLVHINHAEGEAGFATVCPARRRLIRVIIDKERRGELLQVGGNVDRRRRLSDASLVAGHRYDHRPIPSI